MERLIQSGECIFIGCYRCHRHGRNHLLQLNRYDHLGCSCWRLVIFINSIPLTIMGKVYLNYLLFSMSNPLQINTFFTTFSIEQLPNYLI